MPQFRTIMQGDFISLAYICGAYLVAFVALVNDAGSASGAKWRKMPVPQPKANFSIEKRESATSHDIYVTYLMKDRHLTDVNASVTIQYVPGARPTIRQYWRKWLGGDTKTFSNTESRFGRIKNVDFVATAKEHSFKDGKETVRWVRFAESRSFEPDEKPPQAINADLPYRFDETGREIWWPGSLC